MGVTFCGVIYLFIVIIILFETSSSSLTTERGNLQPNYSEKSSNLSLDQSRLYTSELLEFQKDFPKRRKKRFIYYNVDTNLDVGFFIVIPVTLVIPHMSNLFNKWRRKRSVQSLEEPDFLPEVNKNIQPHLDRILMYFEMLDIPEYHCQLRAICELSAEPWKYYPVSDLITGRLRHPSIPPSDDDSSHEVDTRSNNNSSRSLFRMFTKASNDALLYGPSSCQKKYESKCKYSLGQLLSKPAMRVFNAARSHIGFRMIDNDLSL